MGNPIFSVVGPVRRPQYYQNFYSSISANVNVPFEIIFVGPNPPTESMPNNFKHILSNASPCQCVEIAVRNAVGDYIIAMPDDVVFSDGFLNKIYGYTQKLDRDKVLISFRFWLEGENRFGDDGLMFSPEIISSAIVGCGPVFRRDIWIKLGGLDRRFHLPFFDLDMQARFYEYGMSPFIAPDCFITEIDKRQGPFREMGWKGRAKGYSGRGDDKHPNCSLIIRYGFDARLLLNSLWITADGQMSRTRLLPVDSFTEDELKT